MHSIRLAVLFAALNLIAPVAGPLRVLRTDPSSPADPSSEIKITFDRPVAGSLDATVEAARLFRITPTIPGKVEWRDPVTIRFTPSVPMQPGVTYTVTVANDFEALDGSRLEKPYSFTVEISPPKVLTGNPVSLGSSPRFLPDNPTFKLLLSAEMDANALVARSFIELDSCGGGRIALTGARIHRVERRDPFGLADDTAHDLRRVVEMTPATRLPHGCTMALRVPFRLGYAPMQRWVFRTYGPLQVDSAGCASAPFCATGPIRLVFNNPVSGDEIVRHVRIGPTVPFTVRDTSDESEVWILDLRLKPTEHYAIMIDSLLTDKFGQRLPAMVVKAFQTTSYAPAVSYDFGRMLIERDGLRTLGVQTVNVDTLVVTTVPVPESKEAQFLGGGGGIEELFQELRPSATQRTVPVKGQTNVPYFTGVSVPAAGASQAHSGTLVAMRVVGRNERSNDAPIGGIALVQVTDLAVHGRIGFDRGMVWVTGVHDGLPRAAAAVTLYDAKGKVRAVARTDAQGLARFPSFRPKTDLPCNYGCSFEGYLAASLGDDRAVVAVSSYDEDLSPWRFGISGAWGDEQRIPAAAAVFTERGIYRPGESVYAKAIVRRGTLGALAIPAAGDSLKWIFNTRSDGESSTGVMREKVMALSAFGTAQQVLPLPRELPLGDYGVQVQLKREGRWHTLARTSYLVAEYRPPEFLVDVNADPKPRFMGDTLTANITARYLFGAPMARAPVRWILQQRPLSRYDLEIPNTEGWNMGGSWGLDADDDSSPAQVEVMKQTVDTLDAAGALNLRIPLPAPSGSRGARMGILAVVTDANRQTVTSGRSVIVHPASFYIAAKGRSDEYFWKTGAPVRIDVIAVRPSGERVSGVNVSGVVVRREWHRVRRTRGSEVSEMGAWVTDTIATCKLQTAAQPATCAFTPKLGGSYNLILTARDEKQRPVRTVLWSWAVGDDDDYVPWDDESQLKMNVVPDRERYSVGDTATLMIAAPFTNVEAWVTIERERVLESRRIRITSGTTTIKVPITEALAPNAFVSVLLVRGRSAAPGPLDDPGRPTIRVGYAELRVLPAVKKLSVKIAPELQQYRPGDSARVRIAVKDAAGAGRRSEVTLWAVDEGVLSLTGYKTPDPIDLIYQERLLGVRLASNLTKVAAQIPEGQKGGRSPGGGGGADVGGILRSRFQTTAFFLGSVITDASGNAIATAKLPDNLTTFRLMAVAVTTNDRYGSGQSTMLVTRPLVVRPALPRFVREGDRFTAGVLINSRMGGTQNVDVQASARGIALDGSTKKNKQLAGAAAGEVRFDFRAQQGDSARFQFVARAGKEADAVAIAVPVRPNYHPLAQTIAGTLVDTATVDIPLGRDVDPERSRVEISFGGSPLAFVQGARTRMEVYPYWCTEQVSSAAFPIIALYRARKELSIAAPEGDRSAEDIATALSVLSRRQKADGSIGYWNSGDWSTPWLTAYAGRVFLEAKLAGIAIDPGVLQKIGDYLSRSLHPPQGQLVANIITHSYYSSVEMRHAEEVASVDLLSRLGRPDVAFENTLLSQASEVRWEDRLLLAEAFMRRGQRAPAEMLLTNAWQGIRSEGRKVVLPPPLFGVRHYFWSEMRPYARLVSATVAINPVHPLLGQLVETVLQHGRAANVVNAWNTQDLGQTVLALMSYERLQRNQRGGVLRIRGESRNILEQDLSRGPARDTTMSLSGLVAKSNPPTLRLQLSVQGQTAPAFYFVTVYEVPRVRPVTPLDNGIQVERWYERVTDHTPIVSAVEGDLVRVKLRIRVPTERQFIVLDDPLPAGLEAVDLSLRTVSPFGEWGPSEATGEETPQREDTRFGDWYYGSWDSGAWSAFDHKELRDERVVYSATLMLPGTYTATYLARATTAGAFILPPAHAEEMYNPSVNGRNGGGVFTVTTRGR